MNSKSNQINVALADDHILLRNALASLINAFGDYQVILEVSNGKELLHYIDNGTIPDIIILDLNMPEMDGFETASALKAKWPKLPILMLTMYDSELTLIRLLQYGVKGFIKKDSHPDELKYAIRAVITTGFYYSHHISGKLANLFRNDSDNALQIQQNLMSELEMKFLEYACTELTYKEIALRMGLTPRSVDNIRDNLFIKLDVKSRVGLAMFGIRNGLVKF